MQSKATAGDRNRRPVAIVGAGSIGSAFAIVFAGAGRQVHLYDPDTLGLEEAQRRIKSSLADLAQYGLLDEPAHTIESRIVCTSDLATAVSNAEHVQECAPERLDIKRPLLTEIESLAPADAIIASSASALPASRSAAHLASRERCLVCHPANPPFLIRVIEIVPAPFTAPETVERTRVFMAACGMAPIVLRKEVEGFVFNRLQGAVLREAYCLFRDGVASLDEIDSIMRDGLGLRWSFMGPFETVDLNTRGGLASHAGKMGPAYARMGKERGQDDPWTPDLVERATAERRALLPLEEWTQRTAWRDRRLMALLRHRREIEAEDHEPAARKAAE